VLGDLFANCATTIFAPLSLYPTLPTDFSTGLLVCHFTPTVYSDRTRVGVSSALGGGIQFLPSPLFTMQILYLKKRTRRSV